MRYVSVIGGLAVAAGLVGTASAAAPSRLPDFDIGKICNSRQSDAPGSAEGCRTDERRAKQELQGRWSSIPAAARETCIGEVKIGGLPSYIDVLTCTQMEKWSKEGVGTGRAGTTRP